MTVATEVYSVSYTGNASQTAFPVSFAFYDATDLVVTTTTAGISTTQALNDDYTVTGGAGTTGTVTFATAPASGTTVDIARVLPFLQNVHLNTQGPFSPAAIERALDKSVLLAGQVHRAVESAVEDVADLSENVEALSATTAATSAALATATAASSAALSSTAAAIRSEFAAADTALLAEISDTYGAPPATLADLLATASNVVGLRAFGPAVGNGTANDSSTLTLAAASGKTVLIPEGTFNWPDGNLDLSNGTKFIGVSPEASIIQLSSWSDDASRGIRLVSEDAGLDNLGINVVSGRYATAVNFRADRTFMRRCKVNFTSPDSTAANVTYVFCLFASGTSSIYSPGVNEIKDIVIEDNDLTLAASSGVGIFVGDMMQLNGIKGLRIEGNRIHDVVSVGSDNHNWSIYVSKNSKAVKVLNNKILNNTGIGGIHLNDDPTPAPGVPDSGGAGQHYAAEVRGNIIQGVTYVGLGIDYCVGALVANNHVESAAIGISITGGTGCKFVFNHITTTVASGFVGTTHAFISTVDSTCTGHIFQGNTFGDAGAATTGVVLTGPNFVFANNQFVSSAGPPAAFASTTAATALTFTGNRVVTLAAAAGSVVAISGANSLVHGNVLYGGSGGTAATALRLGGDGIVVQNNVILPGTTNNNAIFVASGATGCIVRNNLLSAGLVAISDSGTNTLKNDNLENGAFSGPDVASATQPGIVSITSQTLAGNKTFSGNTLFTGQATANSNLIIAGAKATSTVSATGITAIGSPGEVITGKTGMRLLYTAFTQANTSQALTLMVLPARMRIVGVYCYTTIAWAGLAGTIQLRLGTTPGGTELILDHDVKTAAVRVGHLAAHLGAGLTTNYVQGGYIPNLTNSTTIYVQATSGSGNLGNGTVTSMTAGQTDIIFLLENAT